MESKTDSAQEVVSKISQLFFHSSFYQVYEKLKKWISRFPGYGDSSIFTDLLLFYSLATKKYLDHRRSSHLYRIILSVYLMQKKLLRLSTFSSDLRHLEVKWFPASLVFPFASKPVLGCLIGFNLMDRYEVFDEENILLVLQKHLPGLRLVKESTYVHRSQHQNLKIFYLELEKSEGSSFSLTEQTLIKKEIQRKVKSSIQKLSPAIFMSRNEEEVYKNILALSQEIHSTQDLPQVVITLEQQTAEEIVFLITLVYVAPPRPFFLGERFSLDNFVSERVLIVRYLDTLPVEAHVFKLHLPRDLSLLRSDGSLDFYSARQQVVELIVEAIGEFRDYNGGILIKQQELLKRFKENFPEIALADSELIETFFYNLVPLEKQVLLNPQTLANLFSYFLEVRKEKIPDQGSYFLRVCQKDNEVFFIVKVKDSGLKNEFPSLFQAPFFRTCDVAYNIVDIADGVFFSIAVSNSINLESVIEKLREFLHNWQKKIESEQVLKIGLEYTIVSLDPRIGGDTISSSLIRLLFEGLTRFGCDGKVENGIADTITASSDCRQYTFKLRDSFWNDGSLVSAYDFEYAWKTILSPGFKTSFAYLFYPIKNAKEAKEGKVSMDEVGIKAIDEYTLKVELNHPTHYFLELTAHIIYSPVHRLVDQRHPQWPYQDGLYYPCNGPFQLKVSHPSEGYKLVKNPHYWNSANIMLDQMIFTRTNSRQALQALQKGEIDWIGNPVGAWHPFYVPGKDETVVSSSDGMVGWCVFNCLKPLFHHQKLRKAFALSLQRALLMEETFAHLIHPAYTPLFSNHSFGHRCPDVDVEEARRLWAESLQELGLLISDFPVLTIVYYHKGIREMIALSIQKQLKEALGLNCKLKPLPWNEFFYDMTRGNFEIGLMQWASWVDDPVYTLNAFRSMKEDTNFSKWEHPIFRSLLDMSDKEVDTTKRSSYLAQAEKILCDEMPVIPLFYQPYCALTKKNLGVAYQACSGQINFTQSFYKKEAISKQPEES